MNKLSNTEAGLRKSVANKKACSRTDDLKIILILQNKLLILMLSSWHVIGQRETYQDMIKL